MYINFGNKTENCHLCLHRFTCAGVAQPLSKAIGLISSLLKNNLTKCIVAQNTQH